VTLNSCSTVAFEVQSARTMRPVLSDCLNLSWEAIYRLGDGALYLCLSPAEGRRIAQRFIMLPAALMFPIRQMP
jgi:hypothetical protein